MLTAEQLAARKNGIGSSDIAALFGEDPFKGPLDVWLDKTGRHASATNVQAELGHLLEPVIASRFAKEHAVKLRKMPTMSHRSYPWAMATPDRRICGRKELLEAKNVGYRMQRKWRTESAADGEYRVPPYVELQVQWQLLVTSFEAAWVVAFLGGRDPFEYRIEADQDTQSAMLQFADRWWQKHVRGDVEPLPDPTEHAKELLDRLYPMAKGQLIAASSAIEEQARAYSIARADEKEAAKRKLGAANILRATLGDSIGTKKAAWGQVLWKESKGRVNWSHLAAELSAPADLVAKHTGEPTRTLTVKLFDEEDSDGSDS